MKCVKPGAEIFQKMIADAGMDPAESVFIDDGAANAAMGSEQGFTVLQPMNGEDWRDKLEALLQA
jgi:putative hydrolase of the HAD superfamily